ncbi:MAG TPA: CHAP domain-containing protein [Acidimicrobiales bacterium]
MSYLKQPVAVRGEPARRHRALVVALIVMAATVVTTAAPALPSARAATDAPATAAARTTTAATAVTAPWSLAAGETLTSPSGNYVLAMQGDGNLVEHLATSGAGIVLWSAKTYGHAGAHADLGADGRLRVVAADATTLWQDPGAAAAAAAQPGRLQLRDDGRVVATTASGSVLWSNLSFGSTLAGGSGVLGPGQTLDSPLAAKGSPSYYELAMQADGNLVEYVVGTSLGRPALWSSRTSNHPGAYARLTADGHLQVFSPSGSALYTSANPSSPADQRPARMTMPDDSRLVIQTSKGFPLWSPISFGQSLRSGATLYPGQWFSSSDGAFTAGMSTNGALFVWDAAGRQVWAMSTHRWRGATATMQGDGNLVVRDATGKAEWASRTSSAGAGAKFSANDSLDLYRGATVVGTIYRGLRDTIVALAMPWIGYTVQNYCNTFSAYWGDGVPCPGGRSEAWCADFVAWVWAKSGVKGMQYPQNPNGFPISWRNWAAANGRWHPAGSGYRVRAGDAVVYGLDVPGRLGHVAIATGGLTNGYPDTINGDFGGFTTRVEFVAGLRISDHDDPRTVIAGYVTPS